MDDASVDAGVGDANDITDAAIGGGDPCIPSLSAPACVALLSCTTSLSSVARLGPGGDHACAVLSNGALKCWGKNSSGQLGDGTADLRVAPVDVIGLGAGVLDVAGGFEHTCALLDTGAVKCWGEGSSSQLGDGNVMSRFAPVDVTGLSSGVVAITAGDRHTCALLDTGAVKCWGRNTTALLGDGTTTTRSTPTDVIGLSSGVIALSVDSDSEHTCALLSTGAVKCWGQNSTGELGDGTRTARSVPVDVVGLSSGVTDLATGGDHTCALLSSGDIKCWGSNNVGQLGSGVGLFSSTSVDIIGLSSSAIAISAGERHTCALLDTVSIECWGDNAAGQTAGLFDGLPRAVCLVP
jgi:alpha-tubulin suppressor-like RCC1 family protein